MISLIRLVDVFSLEAHKVPEGKTVVANVNLLVQFRGGPDEFTVDLDVFGPENTNIGHGEAIVKLPGGMSSYNLIATLPVIVASSGDYRIDVLRGKERLARLPFHFKLSSETAPDQSSQN